MTHGKVHRRVLNDEQLEWLRRWFPTTENKRLSKAMKISLFKLHEFARENGLTKSEAGMKAIKRRQVKAMVKTNEKNGCYDRKRGRPVSEATREGNRRRWEEERLGLRENVMLKMRRENPEKYAEIMKKRSQERKESIRKEKMRIIYGLERKTRLKIIVMKKYTRSQIAHRHDALRRGYLLDEDCSEGQPGRYVIYYDDETNRSERFEKNCIADGFRFERD
jgi:hypothetical protein